MRKSLFIFFIINLLIRNLYIRTSFHSVYTKIQLNLSKSTTILYFIITYIYIIVTLIGNPVKYKHECKVYLTFVHFDFAPLFSVFWPLNARATNFSKRFFKLCHRDKWEEIFRRKTPPNFE